MRSLSPTSRYGWWLFGLACLLPALLVGCGGEKLYPVSGKVSLNGTPMTAGTVQLWPEGGKEPVATGSISSDGTYKVLTKGNEGAPLGKYKATVNPAVPPGPGMVMPPAADPTKLKPVDVPPNYLDEKATPLHFEVTASPTADQYDLSIKK